MIQRIPQRTKIDCAICAVAMVMGAPFLYERVLADSAKYQHTTSDGKFLPWWEPYLRAEGFDYGYRPFADLHTLRQFGGAVVGMLGMDIPHIRWAHIVAVDEIGVVDSADNSPPHMRLGEYVDSRTRQGVMFHNEWLAVKKI